MRLFSHPASPNCVAVVAAARRLGSDLDVQHVDLFNGEQRKPEFLALNPNGLVPVLRSDDFVLWETLAILEYLGSMDTTHLLLPEDPRQRANVSRWMAWGLAHWNPALQPFIFERMFKALKGLGEPDEQRLAATQPKLHQAAVLLDTTEKREASNHQRVAQPDGARAPVRVVRRSCRHHSRALSGTKSVRRRVPLHRLRSAASG
jgi:glutathione S-transferase